MGVGRGPKLAVLELTAQERETLQGLTRRPKTAQALALRARIVLACADGLSNSEVSRQLDVSLPTVGKWRKRFVDQRVDGLRDEARPGQPRKITDAQIETVIVTTLEHTPANKDSHWSTRSMAKAVGLNQTAVSRIWRAFGLKPHLADTWKLSTDPLFIDKVRDIVGLYLDPPQGAMVLAVDEKSQIQALDRTAPMLPMMPGVPGRTTHDYTRHGTTSLCAALDVATGMVIGQTHRKHRHQEFLRFLKTIDKATPSEVDLHLVLDNYATPQDTADPPVAGQASEVPPALHPDLLVVAQPGRAPVRVADRQATPSGRAQEPAGPRTRHPRLDHPVERQPAALQLDQERRRDPRTTRLIS
jgi:transposase